MIGEHLRKPPWRQRSLVPRILSTFFSDGLPRRPELFVEPSIDVLDGRPTNAHIPANTHETLALEHPSGNLHASDGHKPFAVHEESPEQGLTTFIEPQLFEEIECSCDIFLEFQSWNFSIVELPHTTIL